MRTGFQNLNPNVYYSYDQELPREKNFIENLNSIKKAYDETSVHLEVYHGQQPRFWICNEAGRGSKSPRRDGERCVTPARAAAKETRIENAKVSNDRCCSPLC